MNRSVRITPAVSFSGGARWVLPVALSLLALCSTGCAILGGDDHVFGEASLGDAAARAKPDSSRMKHGSRSEPLDVGWHDPDRSLDTDDSDAGRLGLEGSAPPGSPSGNVSAGHEEKQDFLFGLVAGAGGLGGESYDGYGMVGLHLGAYYSPRVRFDLIGSLGGVNFAGQSVAGQSFRNEIELAVDISGRYYLSGPHTFFGVYPIAGMRYGTLFWEFARPIEVTENGETRKVDRDQVGYFSLYGGGGVSLMQIRHVHVGTNVTAGMRLYAWQTRDGFSNDLFPATGFVQVMFETSYRR